MEENRNRFRFFATYFDILTLLSLPELAMLGVKSKFAPQLGVALLEMAVKQARVLFDLFDGGSILAV